MPIAAPSAYSQARGMLRRQHQRLADLYNGAIQAQKDALAVGKSLTKPLTRRSVNIGSVIAGERVAQLDDLHEAAEVRNIYAGTVIDVMELALSPLVQNARANGINVFTELEPKIKGIPVWKLIHAGRNNHHHWSDWASARPPTKAQQYDIIALCLLIFPWSPEEPILQSPLLQSPITHDASLDVLTSLSTSYDELEDLVRRAAYDIIVRLNLTDDNHVVFAGKENGGLP